MSNQLSTDDSSPNLAERNQERFAASTRNAFLETAEDWLKEYSELDIRNLDPSDKRELKRISKRELLMLVDIAKLLIERVSENGGAL